MKTFTGEGVAYGIIRGKIILFLSDSFINVEPRIILEEDISSEIKRFESSIVRSKKQLQTIKSKVKKSLGVSEAGIFHSQLLILEDKYLYDKIVKYIKDKKLNAEYAVIKGIKEFEDELARTGNQYLKERVIDLEDVKQRFLRNFGTSIYEQELSTMARDAIAVAETITPSDSVELINMGVKGLVLEKGGVTTHSAILACAMGIPTIVGVNGLLSSLVQEKSVNENWNEAILDAYNAKVIISPDEKTIKKYNNIIKKKQELRKNQCQDSAVPAITEDGFSVNVYANLGVRFNIESVPCEGGMGVGLFRTEFQYMLRHDFPSEDALFQDYSDIFKALDGKPVSIRLLDVGGDKFLPYYNHESEKNPELGLRSLRFLFANENILRTQLRAILRAAKFGSPKILLPMVTSIEDVVKIRNIIKEEKTNLDRELVEYRKEYVPVGMMIEVPSAIFILDKIKEYVDFFSIGSNDLIQYTLGVDRENYSMKNFFNPSHPAVVRVLKNCVDIIKPTGKELSICGEMASEFKYIPMLVGMGFSSLSMNLSNIKDAKDYIRALNNEECRKLADTILSLHTIVEVERALEIFLAEHIIKNED
ncbi:MAG: phosphoenolpyruvate--protein phosphotransferase [Candidatus Muiribacteriota bacterium]